jgi:hypothetical protein
VKIGRKEGLSEVVVTVAVAVVVSVETVADLVATVAVVTVVVVQPVIAEIVVTIINTNSGIYLCSNKISMKYPDEVPEERGQQDPFFFAKNCTFGDYFHL